MADLKELAGKMVGPLPLGAWALLVAGGLYIAYRRYEASTVAESAPSNRVTYPVNPNYPTTVPGGYLTNAGTGNSGTTAPTDIPSTDTNNYEPPETNQTWAQKAVDYLIEQGSDPAASTQAIAQYLSGNVDNRAYYWGFIRQALEHVGAPPSLIDQEDNPVTPTPDAGLYHLNQTTQARAKNGKPRG